MNGAIQDGDGQCFLLIICKEYDPVYLAASLALSTMGDQGFLVCSLAYSDIVYALSESESPYWLELGGAALLSELLTCW